MTQRQYSNCIWAKILMEGVTFQERTPKDLSCYSCARMKLYKNCQRYEEVPERMTKIEMITRKVREQNEPIDFWNEERMLHRVNDYEDGV